jgi:hypothetical protein
LTANVWNKASIQLIKSGMLMLIRCGVFRKDQHPMKSKNLILMRRHVVAEHLHHRHNCARHRHAKSNDIESYTPIEGKKKKETPLSACICEASDERQ